MHTTHLSLLHDCRVFSDSERLSSGKQKPSATRPAWLMGEHQPLNQVYMSLCGRVISFPSVTYLGAGLLGRWEGPSLSEDPSNCFPKWLHILHPVQQGRGVPGATNTQHPWVLSGAMLLH